MSRPPAATESPGTPAPPSRGWRPGTWSDFMIFMRFPHADGTLGSPWLTWIHVAYFILFLFSFFEFLNIFMTQLAAPAWRSGCTSCCQVSARCFRWAASCPWSRPCWTGAGPLPPSHLAVPWFHEGLGFALWHWQPGQCSWLRVNFRNRHAPEQTCS